MRQIEVLAPAGSFETMKAAYKAGADAVYMGGPMFGARAYADNADMEQMLSAIDYAHLHGRKLYMTVNTLLKNTEIERQLTEYIRPFYEQGLDAVIVQDLGVMTLIHTLFPDMAIHASTQMTVCGTQYGEWLRDHGASRIVTPRELDLSEIANMKRRTGVEIETFVHGALCYCYSGQCLMSSMLGGRSGNRGRCAQPCRLAYQVTDDRGNVLHKKEKYPLSPKDLCTIELLPELCESGIYSFKIEGRMKKLEYAAGVTSIYRKYLDLYEESPEDYKVEAADMERLLCLGNRNGFTKGYYEMRNGRSMMTLTDSSHSSNDAKTAYEAAEERKLPIVMRAVVHAEKPMELSAAVCEQETMQGNGAPVKTESLMWGMATGACPGQAQNRPLSREELEKRLRKTGDTPFVVTDIDIDLEDGLFVPVGQLNELRRSALEQLQEQMLSVSRRPSVGEQKQNPYQTEEPASLKKSRQPFLNVWISTEKQLPMLLKHPYVAMVTLDGCGNAAKLAEQIHQAGKQTAYALPHVLRETSEQLLEKGMDWKQFDRIWVRSYDGIGFAKDTLGIPVEKLALDAGLYVFSREASADFLAEGFVGYTASMELNHKELTHMENSQAELMLYGYAPLMVSAQCVYKNYASCIKERKNGSKSQPEHLYLNDRYQKQFEVSRNCTHCYNVIYNSQPTSLLHQAREIRGLVFGSYRIVFRNETEQELQYILQQYTDAFVNGKEILPPKEGTFTNGHFRRGVD